MNIRLCRLSIVLVVCNAFGLVYAMERQVSDNAQIVDLVQLHTSQQPANIRFKTTIYRQLLDCPIGRAKGFLKHFYTNEPSSDQNIIIQEAIEIVKRISDSQNRQDKPPFDGAYTVLDWAMGLSGKELSSLQALLNGAGLQYMLEAYLNEQLGQGLLHLAVHAHNNKLISWLIHEGSEQLPVESDFVNKKNRANQTAFDIAQILCDECYPRRFGGYDKREFFVQMMRILQNGGGRRVTK
jgi:hypothetical protein